MVLLPDVAVITPLTVNVVVGEEVPIPMRLLAASIERVLESKFMALTALEVPMAVLLTKVQELALEVTASPEASPRVVDPFIEAAPLRVNVVVVSAPVLGMKDSLVEDVFNGRLPVVAVTHVG